MEAEIMRTVPQKKQRMCQEEVAHSALADATSVSMLPARLGLGLAAVGRPAYSTLGRSRDLSRNRSVESMYERAAAVLDAAWAAGVRYFDVARSYGQAEAFLARWLTERGIPADAA